MAIRKGAYPEIPDDELVLIALLGNMASFDELVRRYRGAVTRVARQIVGSWSAAEDVAQDAFLMAFKALPQLQDPANFASWLYAITRHRARRVSGKERRTEAVDLTDLDRLILENSAEMAPDPADEVIRRSDHALIPTALRTLPEDTRIVMELRYYEEWPLTRIAEFLSLPLTTVKWRLHVGRQLVRRYITRETDSGASGEKESDRIRGSHKHNERKRYGYSTRTTTSARNGQDSGAREPDRQPGKR